MSYSSSATMMGVIPKVLPVTGSFIAPFAIWNLLLSLNVTRARLNTKTFLGAESSSHSDKKESDPMLLATRVQANFVENVPLAITLAAIVELNGGNRKALAYVLASLMAARVAHAIGLGNGILQARAFGYYASITTITSLGFWSAYLCKGYWGF